MADETKPVVPPVEITPEILKGIITEAVKNSTKEEVAALKKELNEFQQKAIFPHTDGTMSGSNDQDTIVDTSYFSKQFSGSYSGQLNPNVEARYPWMREGMALGKQLMQTGRPFVRLNKEMNEFAEILKCRGDMRKAMMNNVDMKAFSDKNKETLTKSMGLAEASLSTGGVFVPPEWGTTIIEFATQQSWLLSQIWRYPMGSNILRLPKLVQAAGNYFGGIQFYTPGATAKPANTGEGEFKDDTKPLFEQMTWEAKKLLAVIYLTDELVADSNINIINYITGLFVRAFQYELERRIIAGIGGTGNPCLGIINDPTINIVARQTAGQITWQDVLNLDASLDENFTNLVWITRKANNISLMKLVDNNNRPVFISDYGVFTGQRMHPTTLISYPVHYTRNVPTIGTKGDIILCDPSWYLLAVRQDLTIDQSDQVRWLYNEIALKFEMRLDGQPAVAPAFSILTDAES
jgi:HK97 family phage major capsid protein